MKIEGSTILVTGGGSGIGRELARALNERGASVIVTGRRLEPLKETIGDRASMHAYVLDVADSAAIGATAAVVARDHPKLNVLINNAGIMRQEDLLSGAYLSDAEATVTTNLLGPIRLIHALLPQLLRQASSTIVNVTSGLAFVPLVSTPTYNATKAAMHSYTIALREQLKDKGVGVLEIIPPGVQTDLTPGQSDRQGYMPLTEFIDETMNLLSAQPTPDEVGVSRVSFLRNAEAEGRFDEALATLNGRH